MQMPLFLSLLMERELRRGKVGGCRSETPTSRQRLRRTPRMETRWTAQLPSTGLQPREMSRADTGTPEFDGVTPEEKDTDGTEPLDGSSPTNPQDVDWSAIDELTTASWLFQLHRSHREQGRGAVQHQSRRIHRGYPVCDCQCIQTPDGDHHARLVDSGELSLESSPADILPF